MRGFNTREQVSILLIRGGSGGTLKQVEGQGSRKERFTEMEVNRRFLEKDKLCARGWNTPWGLGIFGVGEQP